MYEPTSVKRAIIRIPDKLYVDFKLKLEHDKIKQVQFVRACLNAYIMDDPQMRAFIDNTFLSKRSGAVKRSRRKEQKKLETYEDNFSIGDVNEIFDILERENNT